MAVTLLSVLEVLGPVRILNNSFQDVNSISLYIAILESYLSLADMANFPSSVINNDSIIAYMSLFCSFNTTVILPKNTLANVFLES